MVSVDGTILFVWRGIGVHFVGCLVSLHGRVNGIFMVLSLKVVEDRWRYHLWVIVIQIYMKLCLGVIFGQVLVNYLLVLL